MKILRFAIAGLIVASAANAATYTVTTTADSGAGSLRQAVLDANGNAGADMIAFNIVGSGAQTIAPATALPSITEALTIDGYTQPGASANTNAPGQGTNAVILIEIDGTSVGGFGNGLNAAAVVTIRGLAINRFPTGAGIRVAAGGNGSVIAGNFLGTDPTGSSRPGPQYYGVDIEGATGVVVGGVNPADRNLLSGSDLAHVYIGDSGGSNTVVKGNLIGTNAAGTDAVAGLFVYAKVYVRVGTGVLIGGPTAGERNVISGGAGSGIGVGYTVGGTAAQATIEGNFIGTDVTGTLPLGNYYGVSIPNQNCVVKGNVIGASTAQGILSEGGTGAVIQGNFIGTDVSATLNLGNAGGGMAVGGNNWTIGGTAPGQGNVITNNGPPYGGIANGSPTGARIRGNRIFGNLPLGIDLYAGGSGGVTPNDAGDADTGPNGLQNYPILTSAGPALGEGAGTHIVGVLSSTASTTFDIDFFSNPSCASRPQEYLQGQDYIGSTQVTTDGSGNATIDVTLPASVDNGSRITATATDPSGNTSEFSQRLIFSMSPAAGPPSGGTNVTISGMLFESGATVAIGGQPATNVNVAGPTQITATTPALPAGSLNNVVVTNSNGTGGTLVNGFVADFADVPGNQFYFHITKLVANAITVGCGTGIYCPSNSVTRQQMAVFLLKSMNGLCYAPPPCTGTVFGDVTCSTVFDPWIEALAATGITGGCAGGNYCPTNPVLRQQMAVFLLKAKHGSSYLPPVCSGDFADVACPGNPFADWIEQLAAEGITGGCGGGNYCPGQSVRRDQMAAFLFNTFQFP
jgi:hypothetical protein